MIDYTHNPSLPDTAFERAKLLQNIVLSAATGGTRDETFYQELRSEFFDDQTTRPLLPDFIRTSRDLSQFWAHIKHAAGSYAERRDIIYKAFHSLLEHLEGADRSPADAVVNDGLKHLNANEVLAAWQKALSRRTNDPDGAITSSRQLLESVCKHIIDDLRVAYPADADLPKLWFLTAQQLNLAPNQHTEEVFKSVLGNCQSIVQYLGTIRNRLGDAHGKGRAPVKAAPRHATLVVNLAGTMATFLVETHHARQK